MGYMEVQGVTKGYRGYKGLQGVTGGFRGLQGVTGGYKLPKSLKSWFLKSSVVFYLKTVLMLTPQTQIPLIPFILIGRLTTRRVLCFLRNSLDC